MTVLSLDDATLTQLISQMISGEFESATVSCLGPTYMALRRGGQRQQTAWYYATNLEQTFKQVHAYLHRQNQPLALDRMVLELGFTNDYRSVSPSQFRQFFANSHRGIRGIEIQYRDQIVRYSPTDMIAANLSFQKVFERFLEQHGLTAKTFTDKGGVIQGFHSRQVFVQLHPQVIATTLHRGNRLISLADLSVHEVKQMSNTMGQWLLRQVQADGRMTYKYFPSRGKEASGNNLIRQFMATLCLIRYAALTQQPEHRLLATHNLTYNLKQFYRLEGDLGIVEYGGKVKLGAVALAALSLLEYARLEQLDLTQVAPKVSPQGSLSVSQLATLLEPLLPRGYGQAFQALCRTVDTLWQPDGAFRTFLRPCDRNDNQNFYPGEALLLWATLYRHTHDPSILSRCYQSFTYYRSWHHRHRNPAFIPWHTQAYAHLYEATGDSQFLDFIFEMNDWLLPLQQGNTARYRDLQGRFYDPDHPEYGPPHASSTGVYLEGLAAAYKLALQVEDAPRAQRYQDALWQGMRSLRQLQFRDSIDLFYISKPAAVQGGLRTTVYNNVIRVDNVQHGLMALMTLLCHPEFCQSSPPVDFPTPATDAVPPVGIRVATAQAADTLTEFRLIDSGIEIQPLLSEIEANADLWLQDTSRQDKVKVQRETNTIYLRSALKPFPPGVTNGNDVHPSRWTGWAEKFPTVMMWLETFAEAMGGELGRATLVRLAPQGCVYRHIDQGDYYRLRDRYHLVLQSPAGSLLGAGTEWVRMQPGECWWFNNKAPHEAYNEANDWRIHLIFDLRPV